MILKSNKIPYPTVYGLPLTSSERTKLHRQRKLHDTESHSMVEPVNQWVNLNGREAKLTDQEVLKCHLAYLQTWCTKVNKQDEYQNWTKIVTQNLSEKGYKVNFK